MSLKKRIIVSILSILSMLIGTAGCYGAWLLSDYEHDKDFSTENLGIGETALTDNSITNFALFGVDQRLEEGYTRSDSIMILSVDNKHKKIKLISVLRDSYVEVEGYGKTKINHAYAYGGPELAVKTLNQNFNLDIKEYATVNFTGMANIIDGVGGVEIDISEKEMNHANGSMRETCKVLGIEPTYIEHSGLQTLNGLQAVEYARIRKIDSDFARTDRQRTVLKQLFYNALDLNITQYPNLAKNLLPYTTTSLSLSEILSFLPALSAKPQLEELTIPAEDSWKSQNIGGVSYVVYDLEEAAQTIRDFIYEGDSGSTVGSSYASSSKETSKNTSSSKAASSSSKSTSSSSKKSSSNTPSSKSTNNNSNIPPADNGSSKNTPTSEPNSAPNSSPSSAASSSSSASSVPSNSSSEPPAPDPDPDTGE